MKRFPLSHDENAISSIDDKRSIPTFNGQQRERNLSNCENSAQVRSSPPVGRASEEASRYLRTVIDERPAPLRKYDQIAMRDQHLLTHAIKCAKLLAGKSVAFIGDFDGTASLLALLTSNSLFKPARITVLDFDSRVLEAASRIAFRYHLESHFETHLYNVFDRPPDELSGQFDAFHVNPPYGASNRGESARLFISRGMEMINFTGVGLIVLPHDTNRPWTVASMNETVGFMNQNCWIIRQSTDSVQQYQLDDDPQLASHLHIAERSHPQRASPSLSKFAYRNVEPREIPHFYGRSVVTRLPRYIRQDGTETYWPNARRRHNVAA